MSIVEVVLLTVILLSLGFIFTQLARAVRLPHSVFLVIFGILAGYLIKALDLTGVDLAVELFPEIILYILLPPLIFESAYGMNFGDLKKDLLPVGVLAVVALILSAFIVGFGLHWVFGLPLLPCLTFGALISATDPVAVVSLCKEVGVPKRLNVLIEGESLLNDGTAIVLFNLMLAMTLSVSERSNVFLYAAGQFIKVAFGGIVVGLGISLIMSLFLKLTSRSTAAQLGLTVASSYLSFIVADHYFHVSGVISTMVVGLYLGSRSRLELSRESQHGMHFIWEFIALSANTFVFFGVGLTVHPDAIAQALTFVLPTLALVYAARVFSVFSSLAPLNWSGLGEKISMAYQAVLVWGALRGGVALGLALLLPDSFPYKQTFLTLATAVVLSTLFINALTMRWFLGRFGLDRLNPGDQAFLDKTMDLLEQKVFQSLDKLVAAGVLSPNVVISQKKTFHDIVDVPPAKDAQIPDESVQSERFAIKSMLFAEKAFYEDLLDHGCVSKRAFSILTRSVRDRFEKYREQGLPGLEGYSCEMIRFGVLDRLFARLLDRLSFSRSAAMASRLGLFLEVHFLMYIALEDVSEGTVIPAHHRILKKWSGQTHRKLESLFLMYPRVSSSIQSYYVANIVAESSSNLVGLLQLNRVLNPGVVARANARIELAREKLISSSRSLLRPSVLDLLLKVPVFATLAKEELKRLAEKVEIGVFDTGEEIVREGEPGGSLYVLTAGMLEVTGSRIKGRVRLFPGDFFGERALLYKRPRNATVTAVSESECLVIGLQAINELFSARPDIRNKVYAIAERRK
ncbi:cation:proton antiporter [Myxococcota bacterium]|nr:cation:proton antiporter [Myxococcota bacterium]MBU1411117.1 cation:proton antiporter [Myxococcota bacterium]MBU1512227.1 cation:proton antiporter [Myxococcota bacterium]